MKRFLIGRFLVLFALAGLTLAPISAAIAMPSAGVPGAMTNMDMDEGMDCCPKQLDHMTDCLKTCPFVALCLIAFGALSAESMVLHLRMPVATKLESGSDFALASLSGEPPSRPPRI